MMKLVDHRFKQLALLSGAYIDGVYRIVFCKKRAFCAALRIFRWR